MIENILDLGAGDIKFNVHTGSFTSFVQFPIH